MKLCKNCAYFYPQQDEVCVRGSLQFSPIDGKAIYQSARVMREKGGMCGPAAQLYMVHPLAWRSHDAP